MQDEESGRTGGFSLYPPAFFFSGAFRAPLRRCFRFQSHRPQFFPSRSRTPIRTDQPFLCFPHVFTVKRLVVDGRLKPDMQPTPDFFPFFVAVLDYPYTRLTRTVNNVAALPRLLVVVYNQASVRPAPALHFTRARRALTSFYTKSQ